MAKLCLIGSTRFIERFHELNRLLTLEGHLVYSVATVTTAHNGSENEPPEDVKETLDLVHLLKIQESDGVVLIGAQDDGSYYLGKSTRREIRWAMMNHKDIFLEKAWSYPDNRITPIETSDKLTLEFDRMIQSIMEGQIPRPDLLEAHKRHRSFMEQIAGEKPEEERPN